MTRRLRPACPAYRFGLGFDSVLLSSAALLSYAVGFFTLAVWRFHAIQER